MANITIDLAGIEKRIYTVRGKYVMIDLDLASYYGVENRSLRQTVRRNIDSFPADFLFKLTKREANELISNGVSQSVIPSGYNTGGAEMYAFTDQDKLQYFRSMFNDDIRSYLTEEDRKEIAEEYFTKGIEKGIERVAKKMRAEGFPVEKIVSATGLSPETIESMA